MNLEAQLWVPIALPLWAYLGLVIYAFVTAFIFGWQAILLYVMRRQWKRIGATRSGAQSENERRDCE